MEKKSFHNTFQIFFLVLLCCSTFTFSDNKTIITNPYRGDGFGAQFQSIIYTAIYAEFNDCDFQYTPFSDMEHNYDQNPEFLRKKEELINFIDNFDINYNYKLQFSEHSKKYYDFFEQNLELCMQSKTLAKIKKIFRENKNKNDFFDGTLFNITMHIRRPNCHDSRIEGADILDSVYLNILNYLRRVYADKKPVFHIYSQGDLEVFKSIYQGSDIVFHINGSVEKTFVSFVFADVLVTTASSFSYVAGLLSEGEIYYIPFWHPPIPRWKILGKDF